MFLELIYRFDRPQKNVQNYPVATTNYMKQHGRIQRGGGGRGSGPPLKNHKNMGFLSNAGPDSLKNHKSIKPAFNFVHSSARQWNGIKWRFAGGPMMARW